jgi:hypothetical protein
MMCVPWLAFPTENNNPRGCPVPEARSEREEAMATPGLKGAGVAMENEEFVV